MTPDQMTRKMAREISDFFKIHQHHKDISQTRAYQPASTQREIQVRANYGTLFFYNGLVEDRLRAMWRKMELWADKHPIPQRFANPLSGKIRLIHMMASDIALTNSQRDSYVVVNENWKEDADGLNKYQRLFQCIDALDDLAEVWHHRMKFWIEEWDAQGSTARERQIKTILNEEQDSVAILNSALADLAIQVRDQKGDAPNVDELRMRVRFLKRRGKISGGLYAINRGVDTTTGVTGGQPLDPGPDPDEYVPDIDTVRDEPEMGTDPDVVV